MEFKIANTGTGIAADHLSDIFERFHPVDSSDTRAHSSVGLGLYTVQKYTALLKGTIQGRAAPAKVRRLRCESRVSRRSRRSFTNSCRSLPILKIRAAGPVKRLSALNR
jgi:signal transduction histidine kinase